MTRTLPPGALEAELTSKLSALDQQIGSRRPRSGRSRGRARAKFAGVAGVISLLVLGVAGVFADGGTLNVVVANNTQYAADITDDGAIVEYIGNLHTEFGSSGSGVFEAFLRTHASPSETGYNSDLKQQEFEFDEVGGAFTHSILVSEIPVVACEAIDPLFSDPAETGLCWELFADINDSDNTPLIQLTDLELYFSSEPSPTGYPFGGALYDFEGVIQINDVNPGSGRGDLRYSVPLEEITIPENCDYGSSTCETYFVLFTGWGDPGGGTYSTDAGFNEWKVKRYPFVEVTKDAETTFTRTFEWDIDKSVIPESWALFDGDSGTSDYTVDVTQTGFTDSDWAVSGTITIENTSDQDAIIDDVTDEISDGVGAVSVDCGVGVEFPYELDEGDTLECTYSSLLPDDSNRTNTAEVTLADGPVFSGDADITFGSPTTLVNDTIHVDDTFAGGPQDQAFSASGQATYSRTFECGGDAGQHDNTATITETGQSDDASVTVTCYDLSVTKTAVESRTRTWNWTIDKSVDPEGWNLFDGDTGTSDYVIDLDKVDFTDSEWHVEGTITVHNNHPSLAATLTEVTDSISGFGAVTVDCPALTVPAGGDLVCTYEADLPDGTTRTNTATATQQNYDYDSAGVPTADGTTDYSDTEPIDFSEAVTTEVDAEVNVTDTYSGSHGPFSDDDTIEYSRTFDCSEVVYTDGHGSYTVDNTATIDETGQSDDASVDVDCYILDVTKDADESFDRTYEWTIDKSADQTDLTLAPDQMFLVNYSVTVDVSGWTDSDFHVEGDITIDNPNPDRDADLTQVLDSISNFGAASVNCPALTVPAGGSLICSYEADLAGADENTLETNTATATQQNYDFDSDAIGTASGTTDYSGNWPVDFSEATITEIDDCIDVNDTIAGSLGTVCFGVDTLPKTFNYSEFVGPYTAPDQCGEHDVPNTADFVTNDTEATGDDSWNVHITVPCPEGCTLTMGYWKTHNALFWGGAPDDPNWFLIGDVDGDTLFEGPGEDFFDTGDTWFEVFWTNVAGRPYYQLAHQWMAAYLNKLSIEDIGGSIPSDVQDALDDGAALLDLHDSNPDIKGKDAKDIRAEFVELAGILGEFNEGDAEDGPEHCDEDVTSSLTLSSAPLSAGFVFLPIGMLPFGIEALRRRRPTA